MGSGRLKPGWTRVAFGDIAICVNDRIDNPADAGVQRYVGLEHLDPDSLVIRRWGTPGDVTATKLRFRKGDIIFGRRRVYQRKLAVADFDGICSAHALVLRANSGAVLSQFLPFFMQSDVFMERAKLISVGSLSPTINWRTLASEEFALPPLDEQGRLVRVLSSVSSLKNSLVRARNNIAIALQSMMNERFASHASQSVPMVRLDKITALIVDGTHQPPTFSSSGVPFLLVGNIKDGHISWNTKKHVSVSTFKVLSRAWRPEVDDILYSLVGSFGMPAMVDVSSPFAFQRHIGLIRTDPRMLRPRFLYWYLRSSVGRSPGLSSSRGSRSEIDYTSCSKELFCSSPQSSGAR